MNIPSSLRILGHMYAVEIDPRLYVKTGTEGDSDSGQNVITLDSSFSESHIAETLLHEILEAIDSKMELGLEHRKISALSECLYQVLKDNQLVFG